MGLFKKLFGSSDSKASDDHDRDGFFMYFQCDRCDARVLLRVHKHHDLNLTDKGYVWHKTIVDSRCFQATPTVVHFDRSYNILSAEVDGGRFISREEFEMPEVSQTTDSEEQAG